MFFTKAKDLIPQILEAKRKLEEIELSRDIDFLGASDFYVIEKLEEVISTAKFYVKAIENISKEQKQKIEKKRDEAMRALSQMSELNF